MPTPEEQALLKRMRADKLAKDMRKASAKEQAEKEAQLKAKKREADTTKLKLIKLRIKELELEEKVFHASVEEAETGTGQTH